MICNAHVLDYLSHMASTHQDKSNDAWMDYSMMWIIEDIRELNQES